VARWDDGDAIAVAQGPVDYVRERVFADHPPQRFQRIELMEKGLMIFVRSEAVVKARDGGEEALG
jgi:hypothetical protein